MNPSHAGFWFGPGAPRHGNCENYTEVIAPIPTVDIQEGDVIYIETGWVFEAFSAKVKKVTPRGQGECVIELVKVPDTEVEEK